MTVKDPSPPSQPQLFWLWVLCLIGLDYFSTLGYQPSIAYQSAGLLAPLATVAVIGVTLFGALPVYLYVAGRSPHGQGSIGLLERLVPGWKGKTLILVLLGFAGTNFVFTRTFSAADAGVHLVENPNPTWQKTLDFLSAAGAKVRPVWDHPMWLKLLSFWDKQMVATVLLLVLGFAFWAVFRHGFTRRVVQLSVLVVAIYLALNALVIASGLVYLAFHWEVVAAWWENVASGHWQLADAPVNGHGWWAAAGVSILLFPRLALGLSGFELSMVIMPLIKSDATDQPSRPEGRIRNARKLLITAALIMASYLLGSAVVTTLLIPPDALTESGAAANRALAYLAHGGALATGPEELNPLFGQHFGSLYDISTVLILCLAGAAVTIGLRDLIPPYLQRLGMELHWAQAIGAILYVFNLVKLGVTFLFHADVNAQRGAYTTSVLALFISASAAAIIDHRRSGREPGWAWKQSAFVVIGSGFVVTIAAVIVARPEGIHVPLWSIVAILVVSMVSRMLRTTELRFQGFEFVDEQSRFLWQSLVFLEFPVLVPHHPGHRSLDLKEADIRCRHRLTPEVPVVFVEAQLGDPSEFYQLPLLEVKQEDGRFAIRISRCTSIPHAIAAAALELSKVGKPPEIHFGWSNENPLVANLNFVLFGQGNIPWMVRELIRKAEPRVEQQPRIVIG
jgi:hypothetical protein